MIETHSRSKAGTGFAAKRLIEIAVVALVYVILARLGQLFAIAPGNVSPVWLPSGVMVALAFVRGPGIWPGVFIGAFLGNVWAYFSLSSWDLAFKAILAACSNGLGDVLSSVVMVMVILRFSKTSYPFDDFKDFALFFCLAVLIGPALSALFGVGALTVLGFVAVDDFFRVLLTWWTGDAVGVLLLAPLVISWLQEPQANPAASTKVKTLVLMLLAFFLTSVLFELIQLPHWLWLLSIALWPVLLILTIYSSQLSCFSVQLIIAGVAVYSTHHGHGLFTESTAFSSQLLELQLFIVVMATVTSLLSITALQRLHWAQSLGRSEQRLAQAQKIAHLGSWELDLVSNELTWSAEVYRIFELDPAVFAASYDRFLAVIHPDDREFVDRSYKQSLEHRQAYNIEHRLLMPDGRIKYINERCETYWSDDDRPLRSLGTVQDITERVEAEDKILQQAHFDSLTNLPNRVLSLDRLSQLIEESKRKNHQVAVLYLDLDDFKKINDSLGHETGDTLLIESASRLRSLIKSNDTLGRLGGDEFILILPGIQVLSEVNTVLGKLLKAFKAPFHVDGREMILTTSVGVSIYPGHGESASDLLRNADSAMYHAKAQGRNTYAYFTDMMNRDVSRRLVLEEQMSGALRRGEFEVHYQPKINVSNEKVIGAEALLRWTNPALGSVSPDEFIPIAEQTGLIVPIGQFVLTQAMAVTRNWKARHAGTFQMAINLSPRQFREPRLVSFIENAIRHEQLAGTDIELEITEGVLMSGHGYIDDALKAINDLGIEIAMDDFGTGYSSLSYLRRYPFDTLKIDRTFINDVSESKEGRELVSAAIAMAHALGLSVVAEGVETREQLEILKELGCDHAQGFLFSKAVSETELFERYAFTLE